MIESFSRLAGLLCLSLLALLSPALRAQGVDPQGKRITEVVFKYDGPRTVTEDKLRNHMKVRAGQTFDYEKLDEDIRVLGESGLVDNVIFSTEPSAGGIRLIGEVTTRMATVGLGFQGNTVFSDNKLRKECGLGSLGSLTDQQIVAAKRKIQEFYRVDGYPDVQIDHFFRPTQREGYQDLIFSIQEGLHSEIKRVDFQGNRVLSDAELRRVIKTKRKGLFSFFTKSGKINSDLIEQDVAALRDHYRDRGYYDASVGHPRRRQVSAKRAILTFPVQEGVRYKVNAVGFSKLTVFRPAELMPALSLVGGQIYSQKKLRADIRNIKGYYGSRGYADVQVAPDIRKAGPGLLDIFYRVTEGRRYLVGRVNIQGNTKTQDKVIRREAPLKPGGNFNSNYLEVTRKRLMDINYFEDVQVSSAPSARTGYRDVNVLVSEKKTGNLGFGVGFSSIDNIMGYVTLEQANFNLFNPWNFTGAGQRFNANLRLGTERQDVSVSLVEPWFLGKSGLALGTNLFYRSAAYYSDNYDQAEMGGSVFLPQDHRPPQLPQGRIQARAPQDRCSLLRLRPLPGRGRRLPPQLPRPHLHLRQPGQPHPPPHGPPLQRGPHLRRPRRGCEDLYCRPLPRQALAAPLGHDPQPQRQGRHR